MIVSTLKKHEIWSFAVSLLKSMLRMKLFLKIMYFNKIDHKTSNKKIRFPLRKKSHFNRNACSHTDVEHGLRTILFFLKKLIFEHLFSFYWHELLSKFPPTQIIHAWSSISKSFPHDKYSSIPCCPDMVQIGIIKKECRFW